MAKTTQKWNITLEDGTTHSISITHKTFSRNFSVVIDGEEFEIPTGERNEIFRLGDEQMILSVQKHNHISIRSPRGEEPEAE